MDKSEKVFCVFEGGGAKGVAHLGVLGAIESVKEFDVQGFAGTSAGAIMAALAAVGYSSDELLTFKRDVPIRSPALEAINRGGVKSLAELIGPDWRKLSKVRELAGSFREANTIKSLSSAPIVASLGMVVCWPIFYLAIRYASQQLMIGTETWNSIVLFLLNGVLSLIGWAAFLAALLYLTIVAFQTYHYVKRFSGFASLAHATEVIDELLAQKIPEAAGRRVTFDDVKRYKGKDLKIVATNIHTGSMTLFDCQKFGQLPVSDAVAASAAIPVAFQPISIGNSQYCDGGLVSNLPAWTFDSERLIDEETHVITSELSEVIESENPYGPPTANPKRGLSLVEAVARATAFGASDLNTRGLQDHISLNLDPTIGMLDFENTRGQGEAIVSAKEIATVRFQDHITEIDTIRLLQEGVKELLRAENFYEPRLRTALIREVKLVNQPVAAYEIWKTQNFEDDFDNRLLLPPATSLAGKSINLKEPKFYDLTKPKDLELYHSIRNKKLAQKVLPDDRKWVISIPFDRESKDESGYPPSHLSVAISFDGAQPMNGRHEYFVTKLREYVKENSMFRPY